MAGTACGDGLLGVFFDPNAQNCAGDVPTAGSATLYLCFEPSGSASGGFTVAEFRIESSDASYAFQGWSSADASVIGDPLGNGGADVAFADCQSGGTIAIGRFNVLNLGSGARDAELHVVAKRPPSNQFFPCPLVVLCDLPTATKICVEGGKTILNPSAPRPCGSGREQTEWSRVKSLYR
jgi:hypothetical protein